MKTKHTIESLQAMKPRELDEKVAEGVFDFEKVPEHVGGFWHFTKSGSMEPIPHYSTDANEAVKVAEKVLQGYNIIPHQEAWIVEYACPSEFSVSGVSFCRAICIAAILASQENE